MPNSAEGDDEIKSFTNEDIMLASPKKLDLRVNKSIKVPKMPKIKSNERHVMPEIKNNER